MSSVAAILAEETTVERLDASMEAMAQKGRGPSPSDPASRQAWIMSNAHGIILNMLKQVYVLGPTIKEADYDDFVKYGLMWCSLIQAHHDEETWWFSYLSEVVQVETIEKEHALFHQPLDDMKNYLISCLPAGAEWGIHGTKVASDSPNDTFEAAKLNAIIDILTTSFIPHFCDEISYLDADKLRALVPEENFIAFEKRAQKEVGGHPAAFFVAVVMHTLNPSFPPAPWPVVKILIPWVLYWQYRNLWRFAPAASYWA
ncbi:hypothetical protein DL93DRAFT_2086357 [Clavulina sp. PMI_390]|nr:hypothetical protein DL93DRAFT_2086357 [Clavulina sp. PMI_390]